METIWARLGGYLRAKLIIMLVVGILMYISLRLLGVPFAVPLSVIVALGELVPKIGVWIARVPLLIIAAFQGWATFGLTFLASISGGCSSTSGTRGADTVPRRSI